MGLRALKHLLADAAFRDRAASDPPSPGPPNQDEVAGDARGLPGGEFPESMALELRPGTTS